MNWARDDHSDGSTRTRGAINGYETRETTVSKNVIPSLLVPYALKKKKRREREVCGD